MAINCFGDVTNQVKRIKTNFKEKILKKKKNFFNTNWKCTSCLNNKIPTCIEKLNKQEKKPISAMFWHEQNKFVYNQVRVRSLFFYKTKFTFTFKKHNFRSHQNKDRNNKWIIQFQTGEIVMSKHSTILQYFLPLIFLG